MTGLCDNKNAKSSETKGILTINKVILKVNTYTNFVWTSCSITFYMK